MTPYPLPGLWGGKADPPCLVDAFLARASATPDRTAVIDGDRNLTYADLLRWVTFTAGELTGRGVQPGDRVAVACARSAEAVVALFASALVGAAYLPLDISYPSRRLQHMLTDSDARLLLFAAAEPPLDFAGETLRITAPPADAPVVDPVTAKHDPDRNVYVIYTSGSTGWPKGVGVPHRCLDNMAHWQVHHSPAPDLRTAQFAPLNFDVSFQEILGSLCGGGTLVIMPEELRREPTLLLRWLAAHRVQRLFLPYVALQMLAVAAHDDLYDGLELVEVNTAGEQMVCTDRIRAFFGRLPGCRLVNHYGQSESAMVTSHILTGPAESWPALPPIGVPLPNSEVLVDPVDPAEPLVGELLVAGAPLSAGYLHQPELTARRYVDIPPTPHGHTRAFRTGDLVELSDGVIRFLSRLDDEVKIRGIRVNLLEIDAHLLAEPGVTAAASVVTESRSGARTLRAGLVAQDPTAPPDQAALLDRLRTVLPSVSVPVSLTYLPELPRTPSGKIDRDAVAAAVGVAVDARRRAGSPPAEAAVTPA
ncbi:AMP-binding protein [Micromonospora sp. C31]|uniref:AMP-binding protein n=1 Tax=Micromonospora sp. C31 TaxID=2824876 RepID=UPI001B38585D|nr:AMP-binding protein [Micromonospora sp. C31]MBQ1075637.1 AMP-binding protein [Micromonospora sp. C31]